VVQVRGVVDADAHVDETEDTWEYMTAEEAHWYKPITVDPSASGMGSVRGDVRPHRFWLVDGRTALRRTRDDTWVGTTVEQRELLKVQSRVRHMDQLGVEIQVLYPTYLLHAPSPNPEIELALYRSYNRWLGDKTAEANGRLRWVVMPPLRSMEKALEELRWGKEHGAVGVFKRAIECDGKLASDSYFFPLYEEAQRLDMAICMHTGTDTFGASPGRVPGLTPNIGSFASLAQRRIPERFPSLRFGVIEAMASWFPYVIADLKAKNGYSGGSKIFSENPMDDPEEDFLRANRFYVTCQTSEDVPYLVRVGGEDSLMIGTDYSHDDQSGVLEALNFVERLGEDGAITMEQARKILVDNPRTFYGL
jgi:predicted TIM-barrel fold metal-dependent hydrolase